MDSGKRIHTHRVVETPTLRAKVWTQSNHLGYAKWQQKCKSKLSKTIKDHQRYVEVGIFFLELGCYFSEILWESFLVVQWFSHLHWHVTFQFSQIVHHLTFSMITSRYQSSFSSIFGSSQCFGRLLMLDFAQRLEPSHVSSPETKFLKDFLLWREKMILN